MEEQQVQKIAGPTQAEFNALKIELEQKDRTIRELQGKIEELNNQCNKLNAQILEKDGNINQLMDQIKNLQNTINNFQAQINQLNNEKAQYQAQIPQLQNQLSQIQQENLALKQQMAPLQAQIRKLQEEVAYKDKRIQELKEPRPVMPSSLAQGITSQPPSYGITSSFSKPDTNNVSNTISTESSSSIGTGRRVCPNCGATGFAIKEVEDKSRIISYIPKPQYAKKYICTKCGYDFS